MKDLPVSAAIRRRREAEALKEKRRNARADRRSSRCIAGRCPVKPKLKIYVHVYNDTNSNGQTGVTTTLLKAASLEELDALIDCWQNGKNPPSARVYQTKFKGPKDFFYAGGFAGDDVSFTCKTTGEDMRAWYQKQGWGSFR